jgi:hypothetical protein
MCDSNTLTHAYIGGISLSIATLFKPQKTSEDTRLVGPFWFILYFEENVLNVAAHLTSG